MTEGNTFSFICGANWTILFQEPRPQAGFKVEERGFFKISIKVTEEA